MSKSKHAQKSCDNDAPLADCGGGKSGGIFKAYFITLRAWDDSDYSTGWGNNNGLTSCAMKHKATKQTPMWSTLPPAVLLASIGPVVARQCGQVESCSKEAATQDPCCVPHPSGLFVFRQRFEPDVGGDMGSWGIDGLEVLEYVFPAPFTA